MPRKLLFLCIVMLFLVLKGNAEPNTGVRLSGMVNDELTGEGMAFVTVALLDGTGIVIAASTTDEQGNYELLDIPDGNYMLQFSFVGYTSLQFVIKISEEQSETSIEPVVLSTESRQLNTLTITAKKPLLERKIDRLVMNVADAFSAEGSNGMEVLRKAPGITIDYLGNVLLNGQKVTVWIDDRPSNLSGQDLGTLLASLDGASINKIELIQNPPAKYDAEGAGGIINILTKKNFLKGMSGALHASSGYYFDRSGYYRWGVGPTFNYQNDWMNTSISYNVNKYIGFMVSEEKTFYEKTRHSMYQFDNSNNQAQNAKITNDFYINNNNIVGFVLSGMWTDVNFQSGDNSRSEIYQGDNLQERAISKGSGNNNLYNYSGNLNYQHLFDAMSHDLSVNVDYMRYSAKSGLEGKDYFFETIGPKPDLIFTNTSQQEIDIFSVKTDYTRPLGKIASLETGGKFARSLTDNVLQRNDYITPPGSWFLNDSLSNTYRYNEHIGALYASVSTQLTPKWSAKAGLRWENTQSRVDWNKNHRDTTTHRQYNDFFPTFFSDYVLSPKHYFSLSYTMRIQRPDYDALNPFRVYIGAYTYGEGNPALLPEYTNTFNIGYTFNQFLNISLLTQHTRQVMVQNMDVDTATSVTAIAWANFGKKDFSGLSVYLSQIALTPWWTFNLSLDGYYVRSIAPDYSDGRLYGSIYFENTFSMSTTWKAEVAVSAQSKTPHGYFISYPFYEVWAGIRKTCWNGKGTLTLYLNDVFNSWGTRVVSDRNGKKIDFSSTMASRVLNFTFNFRFGKTSGYQRHSGELEESSRLGKGDSK